MDTERKAILIENLEKCASQIEHWESKPVYTRDSAEFTSWEETVTRWLRLGSDATADELVKFQYLEFMAFRPRDFGDNTYDQDDQQQYLKDLKLARTYIEAAIQNLRLGLEYEPRQKEQRSGRSAVNVSIVNINSMTVSDILQLLQKQVESMPNSPEKKSLLQKLKDISANPLFNTVANIGLEQLVRKLSSGGS